jgi:hypothetical protein
MYTALALTSVDQVIFNRKLRWAGHVRRMDWSSQVPHVVGRRTSLQRTGTLLRARSHARAPADRLQHRQGDRAARAARRLAELGACRSRQRGMAQARSSATGRIRWRLWKRNPCPNNRRRNGLSLSTGLSALPCNLPGTTQSSAGAPSSCHHLIATIAVQEVGGTMRIPYPPQPPPDVTRESQQSCRRLSPHGSRQCVPVRTW